MNQLYFGDCLAILKDLNAQHPAGFIDLVYIDPPFNSKRNYNVLFEEANIKDTVAQKEAFADTWSNVSYKDTISEIQDLDLDLFKFLEALDTIRVSKSAIAYLSTMAIRIYYIHKVLKPTGSFYLHCDPTMSHYLKLVCDLIFGEKNFANEIIWQRITSKGNVQKKFGAVHDVIFRYVKKHGSETWNQVYEPLDESYIAKMYRFVEEDTNRKYRLSDLTASMQRASKGQIYEWKGVTPPPSRCWVYNKEKMQELDDSGRIVYSKNGIPNFKRYLDENEGEKITDIWTNIFQTSGNESLGYPTQKPEALLERIIKASSNDGDLVADFFCGCGTTIAAAQKLKRKWLGADISHLAIGLIEKRLIDSYGEKIKKSFEVHGLPKDIASAKRLAEDSTKGRLGFQDWVIETLLNGVFNPKKTADGGWDGYFTFEADKKETVLIEVKSGHVNVKNVREFHDVLNTANASAGVFVCFAHEVTKPMEIKAKEAGYYNKELFGTKYDKLQIMTVEDLLEGKRPNFPRSNEGTFKKATKKTTDESSKQIKLL